VSASPRGCWDCSAPSTTSTAPSPCPRWRSGATCPWPPRTDWSRSWWIGAPWSGRRLWDLGLLAPVQSGLRQIASPFLHDIYAATLATVHLAVRDGIEVLYVDRLAGHASVPVVSSIGSRLPMHTTGVGKVLMAHAPEEVRREAMQHLVRVTPYSIVQPGQLLRDLERIRRDGYAQTSEEMSLGACSVAVPIQAPDGAVVAALGIVVASLKRDRPRLVSALQVAAQGISRNISQ